MINMKYINNESDVKRFTEVMENMKANWDELNERELAHYYTLRTDLEIYHNINKNS